MKQNSKIYRWVLISLAAAIVVLAIAASYTVGIVSKNNVVARIDSNIGAMESYLQKNKDAAELMTDELKEDYAAKTRTVAMILSQDAGFMTDDQILEEMRVTVNAERISVFDPTGDIVASTDLSAEGTQVREDFRGHLSENVYTNVLFLLESDSPTIVAASSLDSGNGMVQITFPTDNVISLLQEADLSNAASDVPLYTSGTTAILDADTLEYISCTDSSEIGKTVGYGASLFKKSKGRFDVIDPDGEKAMLRYQKSGDYLIMAVVAYEDIYDSRDLLVGWVVVGGALLLAVTALALRMGMMPSKDPNEDA